MGKFYSGKKRIYMMGILLLTLLLLVLWFVLAENARQVNTEYSDQYVVLAELPSQLSFTYYEETEWTDILKESMRVKNLNGKLTYGKLEVILQQLSVQEYITYEKGIFWKAVSRPAWNEIYRQILDLLDTDEKVTAENLVFLTEDAQGEGMRLTQKGGFQAAAGVNYFHCYDMYQVYVMDDKIIGVSGECQDKLTLENVFVHNTQDGKAEILYEKQKVSLDIQGLTEEITDTICDIEWEERKVTAIYKKEERISAKVLSFDEKQIEISGYGSLEHGGTLKVYKTYGTVEELDESKLVIGNLEADFVVAKKKVCGIILKEPANIENIRVLLLNPDSDTHHNNPMFVANVEGTVTVGEKKKKFQAGEVVKPKKFLGKKAEYMKIVLKDPEGRIYFSDEQGQYVSLGYRGTVEVRKYPEGYGVVNELPLEQYLYGVVPSEMPASYERDALCTQAVCARSYAYIHLLRGDYAALGAHVDDSTNYQVYNKQEENPDTNLAVDDTVGEVVKYQGEVAEAYFFSTSCGFTGNMEVWNIGQQEGNGYLQSVSLLSDDSQPDISDEDKFAEFIKSQEIQAYDNESPYFRWSAQIDTAGRLGEINDAVSARFQANAQNVQIIKEDNTPGTEADVAGFGAIQQVVAEERGAEGCIRKLRISYEKGSVVLLTEYNIRTVLGVAASKITDREGRSVEMSLLPSAYCTVSPVEGGYVLYGGGYGHGIGMCQNAANGMAKAGMKYMDILMKFYQDITIENIYNEED